MTIQRPTFIMTEQVRTLSRQRVLRPAGYAYRDCLNEALAWLERWTARVA